MGFWVYSGRSWNATSANRTWTCLKSQWATSGLYIISLESKRQRVTSTWSLNLTLNAKLKPCTSSISLLSKATTLVDVWRMTSVFPTSQCQECRQLFDWKMARSSCSTATLNLARLSWSKVSIKSTLICAIDRQFTLRGNAFSSSFKIVCLLLRGASDVSAKIQTQVKISTLASTTQTNTTNTRCKWWKN